MLEAASAARSSTRSTASSPTSGTVTAGAVARRAAARSVRTPASTARPFGCCRARTRCANSSRRPASSASSVRAADHRSTRIWRRARTCCAFGSARSIRPSIRGHERTRSFPTERIGRTSRPSRPCRSSPSGRPARCSYRRDRVNPETPHHASRIHYPTTRRVHPRRARRGSSSLRVRVLTLALVRWLVSAVLRAVVDAGLPRALAVRLLRCRQRALRESVRSTAVRRASERGAAGVPRVSPGQPS
jgi:hypothetical protein